jgi:hypothetical protein
VDPDFLVLSRTRKKAINIQHGGVSTARVWKSRKQMYIMAPLKPLKNHSGRNKRIFMDRGEYECTVNVLYW